MAYTFHDWTEKLKQELKTNDLSSKHVKLNNGLIYNPFLNSADIQIPKRDLQLPENLKIAHNFAHKDDREQNGVLLQLLSRGMSCFRICANDHRDWSVLFSNIQPEMLFIDIESDSKEILESFSAFISSKGDNLTDNVAVQLLNSELPQVDFFSTIDYRHLQVESQKAILKDIQSIFLKNSYDKLKIRINVSGNLFDTIPFIRAIRILQSRYFKGSALLIEANSKLSQLINDQAESLIEASTIAMWCKISGVDHLYFDTLDFPEDIEYASQLINIQHLLTYEAKMDIATDPLHGAYIAEYLSEKLIE